MKGKIVYLAAVSALGTAGALSAFAPFAVCALLLLVLLTVILQKNVLLAIMLLLAYLIFFFYSGWYDSQNISLEQGGTAADVYSLTSIPRIDGDSFRGTAENQLGEIFALSYKISSIEEQSALKKLIPGTRCRISGSYEPPKSPSNPHAFDYRNYLYSKKIHFILRITSIEGCSAPSHFSISHFRHLGISHISRTFPENSRGIVEALVYGERYHIHEEVSKAYQELGLIHLLAISGLHVGILLGAVYYLLIRSGMTHERARILLLIILPVYTLLAGGAPSVTRAALMAGLYLLLKILGKKLSAADVIGLAFILMLAADPYSLFHAGFQLSFVVSFVLIVSANIVNEGGGSFWIQSFKVSLISQIGSVPLLLHHFSGFSFFSMFLNMVFVPLYSVIILPFSLITVALSAAFPSAGDLFVYVLDKLIFLTNSGVLKIAGLPLFTIMGKPHPILLFLYICLSVLLLLSAEIKSRFLGASAALLLASAFMLHYHLEKFTNTGEIVFLDVGQGDAIFLRAPYGKGNYLIDTGGTLTFQQEEWRRKNTQYSIESSTLTPFFRSKGIRKLDALILTHGDMDHMGEAVKVLNSIKVEEIIVPKDFARGELEAELLKEALIKNIPVKTVSRGEVLSGKYFDFYVLSPEVSSDSKNNDSLVLYTAAGGKRWLFTGDLENEGEKELMLKYPKLKADVLKVGHHGSRGSTSDEFLNHIQPLTAVISAGRNNRYAHPHSEVLDKLKKREITIYRTDSDGAVEFVFQESNGTFSVHPPYDAVYPK
ncbi:DNA internalization-related competence protein ComEC/Rec2 [Bacillus lacus]|uniref:DNA internalization-related competence protein ComEC/Rec2 n=1 Tax=Metabacillus lacus TaxID=1983721 RepID=A0A7X2LXI7_9BACI|nr:DNA internalization-related competence protein ComEC/Rec2 [Metabacillus lacus]MRX71331.1 DNA internalization-related competence protein ComEC/Rec2 [Metabacillus lacus]